MYKIRVITTDKIPKNMVATNGKIPRNEAATYGEVLREETHCKNPREDIQLQILEEIQVGELGSVLLQDANEDSQLPIECKIPSSKFLFLFDHAKLKK